MNRLQITLFCCLLAFAAHAGEWKRWVFTQAADVEKNGLHMQGGAAAERSFDPKEKPAGDFKGSLKTVIRKPGNQPWEITSSFPGKYRIVAGYEYRVTFQFKSSSDREFFAYPMLDHPPWHWLAKGAGVTLKPVPGEWMRGEFSFTAAVDDEGSVRLPVLNLGLLPAGSMLWIAEVVVYGPDNLPEPPYTIGKQPPLPDFRKRVNWNFSGAWKEEDGLREMVSLNQFWNFAPVASPDALPPEKTGEWGYFLVPGHWRGGNISNFMRLDDGRQVELWRGRPLHEFHHAWYRRTVNLPESWRSREVRLVIERVDLGAEIVINGKALPVTGDRVELAVTELLNFGGDNEIRIRVDSPGHRHKVKGGLMGDVRLEARPKEHLGRPGIRTSLTDKQITVDFHRAAAQKGQLAVVIRDVADGREVFRRELPFQPRVSLDFVTPKLWSPEEPALYFMDFTLKDAAGNVLDRCTRRFGFREFRVAGGQYLLNGSPYILKCDTYVGGSIWEVDWHTNPDYFRQEMLALRKLNLNGIYFRRGLPEKLYDVTDEVGVLSLDHNIFSYDELFDTSSEKIEAKLEERLRSMATSGRYWNHPSLVGFVVDIWFNHHPGTMNPEYVGLSSAAKSHLAFASDGSVITRKSGDPNLIGDRLERKRRLDRMAELHRRYFPDQVAFTGGSGEVADVYGTHIYHTWGAPMAEMRALFSRWGLQMERPIFIGEHCIPFPGSFYTINSFGGMAGTDPLFKENAARIDGPEAYARRPVYGRKPSHVYGPENLMGNSYESKGKNGYYFHSELYLSILEKYLVNLIPAWRFTGVNGFGMFGHGPGGSHYSLAGQTHDVRNAALPADLSRPGFKPEILDGGASYPVFDPFAADPDLRPTTLAAPLREAMADLACNFFDAGADPLLMDHAWFGGETLEKVLAIMNDRGRACRGELTFELVNPAGLVYRAWSQKIDMAPRAHARIPVKAKLPRVDVRGDWKLRAKFTPAEPGEPGLDHTFNFELFPSLPPLRPESVVTVCDPEGKLTAYLRGQGCRFREITDLAQAPEAGILLIGRRALALNPTIPDFTRLADRGLRLLILEQEQSASGELMRIRTREAFINAAEHPVLTGFRDCDFANWRGGHSLLPAYQANLPANRNWSDWGNRNMLASFVFRRPPHGNYLSLLASGYDLYQTPLLEYRGENGGWISSQLEMSDRLGIDPVATTLLTRLVNYLDQRGTRKNSTLFYGGAKGEAFLKKLRVDFRQVENLAGLADCNALIVSDPDWEKLKAFRFEINDFVYRGGKFFYLHQGGEFRSSFLPFTMTLKDVKARQALAVGKTGPLWKNGWGNSELYWHDERTVPAFSGFFPGAEATAPAVVVRQPHGEGDFVFVSIHPESFGNTPAAGKTSRLLSALLTSSGVRLGNHSLVFSPKTGVRDFIDLAKFQWEFAIDPDNVGLEEKYHLGARGKAKWMHGLIADGVEVVVGQPFETFLRQDYDGWAWYRLQVEIPESLRRAPKLYFSAGAIDDFDEVYINGVKIGATGKETPQYWQAPRLYEFPGSLLKEGKNQIAVRVFDEKGEGGIVELPLAISNRPDGSRVWFTPWPAGSARDYDYKPDVVRSY